MLAINTATIAAMLANIVADTSLLSTTPSDATATDESPPAFGSVDASDAPPNVAPAVVLSPPPTGAVDAALLPPALVVVVVVVLLLVEPDDDVEPLSAEVELPLEPFVREVKPGRVIRLVDGRAVVVVRVVVGRAVVVVVGKRVEEDEVGRAVNVVPELPG